MKRETKVRNLIRKMDREIMSEMNEGFAGALKMEDRFPGLFTKPKDMAQLLSFYLLKQNTIRTNRNDLSENQR